MFPLSFAVLLIGLHLIYSVNISGYTIGQWAFNQPTFTGIASVGSVFGFMMLFVFNVTEMSLAPLFNGLQSNDLDTGAMVSTDEDDNAQSPDSSYHYWAFHLVMIGGYCYLGLYVCGATATTALRDTHLYSTGIL